MLVRLCATLALVRTGLCFRAPGRAAAARALPAARGGASRWRMLSGGGAQPGGARLAEHAARLAHLRALMAAADLDALIVPSDDPHLSEYPPECFNRREFISGFTGSAGTAVVTATEALLWTDSRYFLQAEMELSSDWQLMRQGEPGVPELGMWLAAAPPRAAAPGARFAIGYDPMVHSVRAVEALKFALDAAGAPTPGALSLRPCAANLVDGVWGGARPSMPAGAVRAHPARWAGESVTDKLGRMRAQLAGADAMLVCALDEIAWLYNLRGSDLPTTPVAYAYALVTPDGATLFADGAQLDGGARAQLDEAGVAVRAYADVFDELRALGAARAKVLVDAVRTNSAAALALVEAGGTQLNVPSPPMVAKAIKNSAELCGMREAHLRDAAALCGAFAWLEGAHAAGEPLDEHAVGVRFGEWRRQQDGWLSDSFPIIVGAGRNGAVIHYRAECGACAPVGTAERCMVLIDSGAQYDCGTTDVTRTIHLGTPTQLQRECFTRVLKGNIALDSCTFPEGTPGFVVDVLARTALWQAGLDYQHGTGHGVGAALNVHEGPQSISARFANTEPLRAGMVLSNEPGFYDAELGFGVRIENLLIVVPKPTAHRFGGKQFLGFERLTHVPIQRSLLAPELLSAADVAWLDEYHAQVRERVLPRVSGAAREWLLDATRPLELGAVGAAGERGVGAAATAAAAAAAAAA